MVGGTKGIFAGISKMFKAGWWIALFPFFAAIKWIFKGVMAIIKLPVFATLGAMFGGGAKAGGNFLLRAFKVLLRPFVIIGSIWKFAQGWSNAHDLDKDGIITKTEKFYLFSHFLKIPLGDLI